MTDESELYDSRKEVERLSAALAAANARAEAVERERDELLRLTTVISGMKAEKRIAVLEAELRSLIVKLERGAYIRADLQRAKAVL